MIDIISERLTNYISINSDIDSKELPKINYAIKGILSEIFKFIIMFFIFTVLDKQNYFLLSFLVICSIRAYSGGIHFYSFNSCLAFSTLIFFITSYITPVYLPQLTLPIYFIISVTSILILLIKAPITSKYRNIKKTKKILKSKIFSSTIAFFFICISFIFLFNTPYMNCAIISIFIQSIQLLFPSHNNN